MAQSPIATAADYADAMLTARRAKNALFLVLLLILMGQIAIFLTLRHWPAFLDKMRHPEAQSGYFKGLVAFKYLVAGTDFLGMTLSMVLSVVLLLIVGIMVVGRLIGVARVTSAFIWCLVLVVLMFPWQSLLSGPVMHSAAGTNVTNPLVPPGGQSGAMGGGTGTGATATNPLAAPPSTEDAGRLPPDQDFKIPGVLYTWGEVTHETMGASFSTDDWRQATLHWARYVVFPVLAMIILLVIQVRSSRGLRLALGETEIESQATAFHSSP